MQMLWMPLVIRMFDNNIYDNVIAAALNSVAIDLILTNAISSIPEISYIASWEYACMLM